MCRLPPILSIYMPCDYSKPKWLEQILRDHTMLNNTLEQILNLAAGKTVQTSNEIAENRILKSVNFPPKVCRTLKR